MCVDVEVVASVCGGGGGGRCVWRWRWLHVCVEVKMARGPGDEEWKDNRNLPEQSLHSPTHTEIHQSTRVYESIHALVVAFIRGLAT